MKAYTRYSVAAILFLLIAYAVPVSGQEIVTADTVFDKLAESYKNLKDYTADIAITVDKEVMKGKLYFKKPNLLRIDFTTPADQVIVSDGEKLTVYLPLYRVALVQPLRKQSLVSAASLASREGLILMDRNYHKAFLKDPTPVLLEEGSQEMVVQLKLTWSSTEEGFRQIDLSIGENGMIRRIVGVTAGYKQVQMDYTGIRKDQDIPNGRFLYDPPPSASVMNDFLGFNSEN